jgi:transcriptional regulator with XRE-family HTH domain
VFSLEKIKKAKITGEKLRISRIKEGETLSSLSAKSKLSLSQLTALESGNLYAFKNKEKDFYFYLAIYVKVINVEIDELVVNKRCHVLKKKTGQSIPSFLRKK